MSEVRAWKRIGITFQKNPSYISLDVDGKVLCFPIKVPLISDRSHTKLGVCGACVESARHEVLGKFH